MIARIGIVGVVAGLSSAILFRYVTRLPDLAPDFHAFYCGARVMRLGFDPYLAQPLAACEAFADGRALPAPLPPYALAAFLPLSYLSFQSAVVIWLTVLAGLMLATAILLRRLTRLPYLTIAGALVLSEGLTSVPYGEVVAVGVFALTLAAWYARTGRFAAAGIAAAGSMIEPHVGLPGCIALFLWCSGARLSMAVSAATMAMISLFAATLAQNVEYFTRVLPAHALSERTSPSQYSLTALLHQAGFSDGFSATLGSASYVVLAALSIAVSGRLAKRLNDPAVIVTVPPGLVLLGGPFIHLSQMCAAIPPLLLLISHLPRDRRLPLALALPTLAIPWLSLAIAPETAFVAAVVALMCLHPLVDDRRIVAGFASVAAAFIILHGLWLSHMSYNPPAISQDMLLIHQNDLAQIAWTRLIEIISPAPNLALLSVKLPTWIGLAALLAATLHLKPQVIPA